jgi:hypothetical protein
LRVLITIEESEIRARGRVDLAKVARPDRPLVVVGGKKVLAAAVGEFLSTWRPGAKISAVLFGESGAAIRTWRAELKRHSIELSQAKTAPEHEDREAIGAIVGIDLSEKPARRTDVRIAVY